MCKTLIVSFNKYKYLQANKIRKETNNKEQTSYDVIG